MIFKIEFLITTSFFVCSALKAEKERKRCNQPCFFQVVTSNLPLASHWDLDVPGDSEWRHPGKTFGLNDGPHCDKHEAPDRAVSPCY